MIIYKVLLSIFLFVISGLAQNVQDPCSEFLDDYGNPLVKCPSEKPDEEYLECYDLIFKEYLETINITSLKNWCWSRYDNSDDVLKDVTISAGFYDNSNFNDKLNRPFTAKFYDNGTHIICLEDESLSRPNPVDGDEHHMICPTSTGIPLAIFSFSRESKL